MPVQIEFVMANHVTKPYEKKSRSIKVTPPNVMVNRVAANMAVRGENNVDAEFKSILGYWIENAAGKKPLESGSSDKDIATENFYEELNRYSRFSSFPFRQRQQQEARIR